MKNYILVKNKEEIFERNQHIQIEFKLKSEHAWKWLESVRIHSGNLIDDSQGCICQCTTLINNFFQACEYDEQTNILGVNYVAYGIAKTRQSLNSSVVPFIKTFTDKENLEMQQELQKRLCVSEMKRLIRANQEIRFHNTEYNIEGAGKSFAEAIKTFIDNAVKSFVKDDIDPQGDKGECKEIYFYNMENCEVYLPKKYVNKIWDEINNILGEDVKIDEATKAEKLWEMNERR